MKSDRITRIQKERENRQQLAQEKNGAIAQAISGARKAVLDEHFAAATGRGRVVQLALKEAEALAWQTEFPHLFFPALAQEKIQAALTWEQRQRAVRRQTGEVAFAE